MKKEIFTSNYGIVTITDVVVDVDGTNMEDGIDIHDEDGTLLAEVVGVCADGITDGDEVESYIETYIIDED